MRESEESPLSDQLSLVGVWKTQASQQWHPVLGGEGGEAEMEER